MLSAICHPLHYGWSRDQSGLRTLPPMREVIENKVWGTLFKILLIIAPITLPTISAVFVHIYSTLNQHTKQLETLTEWRHNHQDMSNGALERLATVEKAIAARELEAAVMKEKLGTIGFTTEKTSAALSVISDQLIRLQQTATESREKIVNLQVQFDDVKSKQ